MSQERSRGMNTSRPCSKSRTNDYFTTSIFFRIAFMKKMSLRPPTPRINLNLTSSSFKTRRLNLCRSCVATSLGWYIGLPFILTFWKMSRQREYSNRPKPFPKLFMLCYIWLSHFSISRHVCYLPKIAGLLFAKLLNLNLLNLR